MVFVFQYFSHENMYSDVSSCLCVRVSVKERKSGGVEGRKKSGVPCSVYTGLWRFRTDCSLETRCLAVCGRCLGSVQEHNRLGCSVAAIPRVDVNKTQLPCGACEHVHTRAFPLILLTAHV